jgi:hypothetical protein
MDCFSPTKKLHYMLVSLILAFAKPFELVVLLLNLFFFWHTVGIIFFGMSHANTHTYMSIHPYKYIYTHHIFMITSERLNQLDLKIYKVGHQECLAVDENITFH